jgi:hypothetical protein
VDPGFFSTPKRFDSLPGVLEKLSSESQVVLPSLLRPLAPNPNKPSERNSPDTDIVKLLRNWNPSFEKNDMSDIFQIRKKLGKFFQKFNPVFADDVARNIPDDGFLSLKKSVKVLGRHVGETVFEFVQITSKKSGIIAGYGRKMITFVRKVRIAAVEGYSQYKHNLIDSGFAPKRLKIIGVFHAVDDVVNFSNAFEVVGMPPVLEPVADFGLMLVADG